jgi:hypothetical protein
VCNIVPKKQDDQRKKKLQTILFFQVICEAYHLMKDALGMTEDEISKVSLKTRQLMLDF